MLNEAGDPAQKRLEVTTVKERQHIYYHHSTEEDRSFIVNSVRDISGSAGKTKRMIPGNDIIPSKRQLKTNNIGAAGGPAPKRLRFIKHINLLEYFEVIVQVPGNTTNSAHSDCGQYYNMDRVMCIFMKK
jgi:hypothetical protein